VRAQQLLAHDVRLVEAPAGDKPAAKQREAVLVVRVLRQRLGQQRVGLVVPV
jgi:hypothetical protein